MTAKLSGDDLTLFRGDRCLFKHLDFALNAGELLLLEGQNGSGKTSLLRAIAGLIELETGSVSWNGVAVLGQRESFHNSLAWMAHRVGFKADLTVLENLQFESALRPQSDRELDEIFSRLGIGRLGRLPMRALSAGQQRRIALARMLMSAAELWIMDEPFTNLDRDGRALVIELVSEHLSRDGMALIAAHQDIDLDVPMQIIKLQ